MMLKTHPQDLLSPSSSQRQEAMLVGCRNEKYFNIFCPVQCLGVSVALAIKNESSFFNQFPSFLCIYWSPLSIAEMHYHWSAICSLCYNWICLHILIIKWLSVKSPAVVQPVSIQLHHLCWLLLNLLDASTDCCRHWFLSVPCMLCCSILPFSDAPMPLWRPSTLIQDALLAISLKPKFNKNQLK